MKIKVFWLSVLIVCLSVIGMRNESYAEFYYKSLHEYPTLVNYLSTLQCQPNGRCGLALDPSGKPYTYNGNSGYYFYSESRTGFRNTFDVTDPKVLCGLEGADTDICAANRPTYWGFSREINRSNEGVPQYFRMYIPPGTVSFGVTLFVTPADAIAAIAHIGTSPSGPVGDYPEIYGQFPISSTHPPKDCWDNEVVTRNEGGHLTLSFYGDTDFISEGDPTFMKNYEKRWFYVKIMNYTGGGLESYQFRLNIRFSALETWYKKMNATPGAWNKLEEAGAIAPINQLNQPQIIPTPIPTSTPIPSTTSAGVTGGLSDDSKPQIPATPTPVSTPSPTLYKDSFPAKPFNSLAQQGPIINNTYSQTTINLQPQLSGINLPIGTKVKYYAAYVDSTGIYFAPDFQKWTQGQEFPYYSTGSFDGNTLSLNYNRELSVGNDSIFVFGMCPNSVSSTLEFVDQFQGAAVKFVKQQSSSSSLCSILGGVDCK